MTETPSPYEPYLNSAIFIAKNATVIGDVEIEELSSVWFGAVIRADNDQIRIGKGSNIQDNAVIHVDPGAPCIIGDYNIIGHGAIVHGAQLDNHVLIGMNAVVLNNAKIGEYSIIGANALVTANTIIPPNSLVLGSPAKVVGKINAERRKSIDKNAQVYIEKSQDMLKWLSNQPNK